MTRIIYGTGKYGIKLYDFFRRIGAAVDYFAQTNAPMEKYIEGIPVVTLDDIAKMEDECIICLAIKSKEITTGIIRDIQKINNRSLYVYNLGDFLTENPVVAHVNYTGIRRCYICNNSFDHFKSGGIDADLFKKYKIIGGGYRDECICPFCGSMDRERWLFYVMKEILHIDTFRGRILHFAPELSIKRMIESNLEVDYYTGDVLTGKAMHVTDITNMQQYGDGVFDYVISNHVLEHVTMEEKAVHEVKRVLKQSGKWVFSFPICTDMEETFEDKTIVEAADRMKLFGQEDHVRLYGKDYKERFEGYGLKIKQYSPQDLLDDDRIKKWGLIKNDVILVAEK